MKNTLLKDVSRKIPIFPLTGAVLFPGTQLPLNIFEPRYVQMIDDALSSPGRLLGMIQPEKPNQTPENKSLKSSFLFFTLSLFVPRVILSSVLPTSMDGCASLSCNL